MRGFGIGYGTVTDILFIVLIVLVIALKIGLPYIPANIARKKGYGFVGFYILGLFFFFVALIISLCLSNKKQQINEIKQAFNPDKGPVSSADELEKYKVLLEQGTISQEEFDSVKKKLLDI